MKDVRFITQNGEPTYAVVPIKLWSRICQLLRDSSGTNLETPAYVRNLLLAGAHPIRAWRKHRGLTLVQLAKEAGLSSSYVTLLELGKRHGTPASYHKIAAVLGVPPVLLDPASMGTAMHEIPEN